MIYHTQVPFRQVDGEWATVDEGLEDIMVALRDRGIRTYYSCENVSNSGESAYILMPMLSGWRFRRTIRGSKFAEALELGERGIELSVFRKKGRRKLLISSHVVQNAFDTEHLVSRRYGLRTVYRWPVRFTHLLREALGLATSED